MRALRIRDENAPPQLPAGKSIHQRNKSTPALSTLMHIGSLKAAATKRTVFADVSNTSRPVVKDDIQVLGKAKQTDILKGPAIVSAKELSKPNALLRPAQRPLANVSTKVNNQQGPEPVASAVPKHVTLDTARNVLSKKPTTIFRETHSDPVSSSVAALVPTRQPLKPVVEPAQQVDLDKFPAERVAKPILQDVSVPQLMSDELIGRKPLEHASADPHVHVHAEKIIKVDVENVGANAHVELREKYEYVDSLEEKARVLEQERNEELAKTHSIAAENDLYLDEDDEEEEEYYDADGYTTARSLRSRGDNTTGGVTLVLAPRITTKSKRELEAAKQFVEATKTIEDVEDEQWDTSMVAEYGEEIFEYMHQLEDKMRPDASYMDIQAEIQWSMRSVLMDWLVQVHNRFTLLPETLFLSVNYVDRFLSKKVVSLGKLQLVGATALFLAAKYEEINCPSVQEIVYMVDGAYTADEVLKAERFMLSMLQFELGWPGPMSFLRRISKADDYDLETRTLSKYFLEITIMDERFVGCAPSFLAAGAHCLARFMLKKGDWVSISAILPLQWRN